MEAISVKCPVCRVGCGRPCRDHSSRTAMSDFHPARASRVEEVGSSHDDPDSFGKWVVRGIAIGIGLLIVEIPVALIAAWWLSNQLSKVGL